MKSEHTREELRKMAERMLKACLTDGVDCHVCAIAQALLDSYKREENALDALGILEDCFVRPVLFGDVDAPDVDQMRTWCQAVIDARDRLKEALLQGKEFDG